MCKYTGHSHTNTQLQVTGVNGKPKQGNVWMSWALLCISNELELTKLILPTILVYDSVSSTTVAVSSSVTPLDLCISHITVYMCWCMKFERGWRLMS